MKKIIALILSIVLLLSLSACGSDKASKADIPQQSNSSVDNSAKEPITASVDIKESPDKYTWYIKNYVGKNCASFGYTSLGGDRMDSYGEGYLKLVLVNSEGTYIDISNDDALKEYSVTGQNLAPNTELKFEFLKDSEGNEYDNLVGSQNYEELVLSVKKVGSQEDNIELTEIMPSPDKYTRYIADYVGRNLLSCGYTSLGGDRMTSCGDAYIKLIIIADDGSFIDPDDEELLKKYRVVEQSVKPNTELKLVFAKDSDGNEYDNLVDTQNIEEIDLMVTRIQNEVEQMPAEKAENAIGETTAEESKPVNGIRPDFKEAMDSYEAFYDEYCEFMVKYSENPTDLTLLVEYAKMATEAQQMTEKFEAWESENLNDEELKYYLDVTNRIEKKLIDIM